jgi:hypothetical protein
VDSIPDPLVLRKPVSARNRTQDLWIWSQELWPLDHNGSLCPLYLKETYVMSIGKLKPAVVQYYKEPVGRQVRASSKLVQSWELKQSTESVNAVELICCWKPGSHYRAMTGEDVTVDTSLCVMSSVRCSHKLYVKKSPINPVMNPNHDYSYTYT